MKRLLSLLFAAPLAFASAQGQTAVAPYTPGITPAGITYFLPQTSVRFVISATRVTHHTGDYAAYAERFLGTSSTTQGDYDVWTLDDVALVAYGTADASQAYTIALNPKTVAPLVTLTPDGRLIAINTERDLPAPLPVAAKHAEPDNHPDPAAFLTPDILRATSRAKKAELIAQEIYDIRENRALLAKGQADFNPTDGQQLQLMLQQLDRSEEALTSLFLGYTTEVHYTYTLDYTPTGAVKDHYLFRFSRHLGLVDVDDLSGEPYLLSVDDTTTLPAVVENPKAKAHKEVADVRYRVPGRAHLALSTAQHTVLEADVPVAQFGRIEHLGGDIFNPKKGTTHVTLSPVTGGIEKISSPLIGK